MRMTRGKCRRHMAPQRCANTSISISSTAYCRSIASVVADSVLVVRSELLGGDGLACRRALFAGDDEQG